MAKGIKDKVAILGMGCSKFGERWDSGAEELMLEAFKECITDAGIDMTQIQAAWFSTARGLTTVVAALTNSLRKLPVSRALTSAVCWSKLL